MTLMFTGNPITTIINLWGTVAQFSHANGHKKILDDPN